MKNDALNSCILKLEVANRVLDFYPYDIKFLSQDLMDIFANKNNKTVGATLECPRYKPLALLLEKYLPGAQNEPLGTFLYKLKCAGDPTYKRFLNKYGDSVYCHFRVSLGEFASKKGLYVFCTDGEVAYVGCTTTNSTFSKRINSGYGKISPKKCYKDGQHTNCDVNASILQASKVGTISCYVCPLSEDNEIKQFESQLIYTMKPKWNKRK